MQGSETGKDKVKKICDVLKRETLEPAKLQAEEIILAAQKEKDLILSQAEREANRLLQEAQKEIAKERNVFQASLGQACKQAFSKLKQDIEETLLDRQLFSLLTKKMQDPHVIAELVTAAIKGIEKEGIDVSLSVYIPAQVQARSVNELLAQSILSKLKEKSVLVGLSTGGIELVLKESKITIDLTDQALKELIASYIRKDFREMIFGA